MGSEFSQYIGLPWEAGAAGPNSYACMAFTVMIQRVHFGVIMADVSIPDYDDDRGLVELRKGHIESDNWRGIESPVHGDLVFIRSPMHYGTWLDLDGGGVLHCVRGMGVCFTKGESWRFSGFGRREYLRHKSRA